MAEVEYKGIKVGGSKLLLIIPLIGTIIGGLWGGFEAYQRYLSMEAKIQKFVSPDLSHIENHMLMVEGELAIISEQFTNLKEADRLVNEIISEQVNSIKSSVASVSASVHDAKIELREDLTGIESTMDKQEQRMKDDILSLEGVIEEQRQLLKEDVSTIEGLMDNV